jgi:hypothetical protein
MEKPINKKVAQILAQADKMTLSEKRNLFWVMLEKFRQESIFGYQYIYISETPSFLISFKEYKTTKPRRKLGIWEGTDYFIAPDFDAPLNDLADYM